MTNGASVARHCAGAGPEPIAWWRTPLTACALLRRRYPHVPLYLMGESMGGAVAVLAANRAGADALDGVILLAPAVWGRDTMNVFERVGLWLADLMPQMQWSRGISFP